MKKEKTTEMVEKENDVIRNDNTDTAVETKPETATPKSKSLIIKLEDLVPFKDHPYKVIENESMIELTESISEHGVLNPLLVRPLKGEDGKYEIISGHRRFYAAQKLGMRKVPCTIHFIDRDAATVMMVDSNCQRTELLPSEKAWAYKMKMDAMSKQGKRTDLTSDPVGPKSERSNEKLAEIVNESVTQIKRYIRLTYLVPELLQYVDEGKIGMRPAVEMSYLDEEVQHDIVDRILESDEMIFPSHAQTRRIRQQAENGTITYDDITAIMDEKKPNQAPTYKVSEEMIFEITKRRFTPQEFNELLKRALECYARELKKQRDRDAR